MSKYNVPPAKVVGVIEWPITIPQYELDHGKILEKLEEIESGVDGVWITWNCRTGVAFPNCVTFGYGHVKVVIDHLKEVDSTKVVVTSSDDNDNDSSSDSSSIKEEVSTA